MLKLTFQLLKLIMSQIIFVPYLALDTNIHLSCGNDMRIPNYLKYYKDLLFTSEEVTTFKIKTSNMKKRAIVFGFIKDKDAIVREYVEERLCSYYSYYLEILIEDNFKAEFNEFLKNNNLNYQSLD